ncbi:MAG: DUF2169 domain-containing protein [Thermoanaerobaculia bacterium]
MTEETTQLLAHPQGIAVTAKRTYRIVTAGRCVLADEQAPIVPELVADDGLLVADTDLLSFKPGTDVVVTAEAHAPGGREVAEMTAGVTVAGRAVTLRVVGKRRVARRNGFWAFSDPEPFARAPLGWRDAYGGIDALSREKLDAPVLAPLQKYSPYDLKFATAAAYPRNPVGKGYVLEDRPEVEGLELPTVEDPDDPLTPARLFVGHPDAWSRQPLPAGISWFNYGWFPRSAFLGLPQVKLPPGTSPATARLPEVERGWAPADVLTGRPLEARFHPKAGNGAAPPLVFPTHLSGREEISLANLDPREGQLTFQLPAERPRMAIRPLGEGEREAPAKLMTVIVDATKRRLSLVWAGVVVPRLPHVPQNGPKVGFRVEW